GVVANHPTKRTEAAVQASYGYSRRYPAAVTTFWREGDRPPAVPRDPGSGATDGPAASGGAAGEAGNGARPGGAAGEAGNGAPPGDAPATGGQPLAFEGGDEAAAGASRPAAGGRWGQRLKRVGRLFLKAEN
ncbi:MAG: hypothetical protein HY719_12995, partial [Planctomycetes bacterium]|nr:hypothetical protein [Planctomycetota bacterium]